MENNKKSRVTLAGIAEIAGVSRSAVGHILNGRGDKLRIARETQEKVRKIAEEKGYLMNFAVRQLRSSRTCQVAYVMTGASAGSLNPFALSMMRHLQQKDYQTLIIDVDLKSLEIAPIFQTRRFDGIVIDGVVPNQSFFEEWAEKHAVPYIYLNHESKDANHAGIDEEATAEILVDELFRMGYRKIAYYFPRTVNSNLLFPEDYVFKREQSLAKALSKRSLKIYPNTVEQRLQNENTAEFLMTLPEPPDCVIGFDAFHGIAFKRHIAALGLSAPEDVGLVVYEMSKYNKAADICGIQFDFEQIGKDLANMILERIKNGKEQKNRLTPGKVDYIDKSANSLRPFRGSCL